MNQELLIANLKSISGIVGITTIDSKVIVYYQNQINWQAVEAVNENSVEITTRDIKLVNQGVELCVAGKLDFNYQMDSSYTSVDIIYLGEIKGGKILWQAENKPLSQLKDKLNHYPKELKQRLISHYIVEAELAMEEARKAAIKNDVHYILGCFYRTVSSWNHLLFALNERYLLEQLGAVKLMGKMNLKPNHYLVRVEQAYQYFASHYLELGFEEFLYIHNEIKQLIEQND